MLLYRQLSVAQAPRQASCQEGFRLQSLRKCRLVNKSANSFAEVQLLAFSAGRTKLPAWLCDWDPCNGSLTETAGTCINGCCAGLMLLITSLDSVLETPSCLLLFGYQLRSCLLHRDVSRDNLTASAPAGLSQLWINGPLTVSSVCSLVQQQPKLMAQNSDWPFWVGCIARCLPRL